MDGYFPDTGAADSPLIEISGRLIPASAAARRATASCGHHTGDLCTPDSFQPTPMSCPPAAEEVANTGGRPTQSAYPF